MNKSFLVVILFTICSGWVAAETLTLQMSVKDAQQQPVSNATAFVKARNCIGWNAGAYENHYSKFEDKTNTNGLAVVHFDSTSRHVWTWVEAPGCYPDVGREVEYRATVNELFGYKFEEFEKKMGVTLYKMINPIPMYKYRLGQCALRIPIGSGRYGFDLKKCGWVKPWGAGEVPDLFVERNETIINGASSIVTRVVFDRHCGAYKQKREGSIRSPSTYEALTNATFIGSWVPTHRPELGCPGPVLLTDEECMVIRSRVVCDVHGNVIRANYSKIDGMMELGEWMSFHESSFNPTVNDTNLELDRNRNLSKGRFKR